MKKILLTVTAAASVFGLSLHASAADTVGSAAADTGSMLPALLCMLAAALVMLLVCIIVSLTRPFSQRYRGKIGPGVAVFIYAAAVAQIVLLFFSYRVYSDALTYEPQDEQLSAAFTTEPTVTEPTVTEPPATEPTVTEPPVTEPPETEPVYQPLMTDSSNPEKFGLTWEIMVGDEIVESYTREEPIFFEDDDYFALPGIATFRGNNYRNNAVYGTAEITKGSMQIVWDHRIGSFNEWGGCAWTGQPLVVQWDDETKAIMNLYDEKKEKEGLIEVIYATLDGNIHFYDLEDGSKTRDPIFVGMNFKGAGALDPRGYPILYVGSGIYRGGKAPRMFVVSLIDGSILYEYGNNDKFAKRTWFAFDSSPLVDVETDTLIWPAESGLLYTIKLNTEYDKEAGTISVTPDPAVKTRYTSTYSREEKRYLGYEASAVIVENYLYISENGGLFHCIDLNTMELVWAQDTKDDSNSSPMFEWGATDTEGYVYTAPSLHWTAEGHDGTVSIYKLDAITGEIIWEHATDCVRYDNIAGGVQSSPLMGKDGTDLEGLIIYSIGRTPTAYKGVLTALDRETGEVVWEVSSGNYAWSSPVALYGEDGKAYIFLANASGVARLFDGATGEELDLIDLDETVEASPVVFGNMLVIGSREGVYGIKIS